MKIGETYESQDLWHLDLCKDTTRLIIAQISSVSNSECVWALGSDLAWFAAVQLSHALNFCECNEVAVFQAVSGFVQASDQAFAILYE